MGMNPDKKDIFFNFLEASEIDVEEESQKILEEYFYEPYREFLNMEIDVGVESFKLGEIIKNNLEKIKEASDKEVKLKLQKEFIRELVKKLNNIPVGTWSLSPKQILETGRANCSNLSAVLVMIIENNKDSLGIKDIKYVEPYGHVANVVHFVDGSIYFADARSGNFFEITDNVDMDERENVVIYKNRKLSDKLPVKFLPAMQSNSKGFVHVFANNASLILNTAEGKLDDVLQKKPQEERRLIIIEAKKAQNQLQINEVEAKKLQDLARKVGKPIYDFMESPQYLEDGNHLQSIKL